MRNSAGIIIVCCVMVGVLLYAARASMRNSQKTLIGNVPVPTTVLSYESQHFLFVPYWSFTTKPINNPDNASLIYFALTTTKTGINTQDSGYQKMAQFQKLSGSTAQKYLAVQMIDAEINTQILKDTNLQSKIIDQTIAAAQSNNFNGIVIDFETSSLSFQAVTDHISSFIDQFEDAAHNHKLKIAVALYGDTLYRVRPYNVADLAKNADTILVMAYDFTKTREDPGPNFPLHGKETYGYDFTQMATDFLQQVPPQKLAVIFGMFGYDWQIDTNKEATDTGMALTDSDIQKEFIASCEFKKCSFTKDAQSAETNVLYTDLSDQNHSVWFQDQSSVTKKTDYLNSKGIKSTGYWAYSYY